MTYRTNALGNVMSSIDGRIWTKLPPKLDRRMKRDWARFRFTFWTPFAAVGMSIVLLLSIGVGSGPRIGIQKGL